jgi:tetratricopeptide (TPR) repeat protein
MITIGLAYYAFDDYDTAYKYFSDAINLDKWTNSAGKEIAYLLRGNATSRLASINKKYNNLGEAEADYAQAWEITRQTYGRALLGLGGVRYLEALGDPNNLDPATINQDLLATAEATFEQALALPGQPESHNIPAKAHFSLGQSYLVRALILGEAEAGSRAQAEFDQVIQAYEGGSTTLQEIASFAYARLGLLEALVNGDLEESARRYQQAYDISSPYFKADNAQSLGRVYFDQGIQFVKEGDSTLASQKFSLARKWLEDGIRLAESLGRQELIDDYQTLLDDLLANYGQYLTPMP